MNDFDLEIQKRHEWLLATHPIHSRRDLPPKQTTRMIPVHEKIAQLKEARDCYSERIAWIDSELAIYEGDQ
ncbi:MAG: hypothetical protein WC124_02100 [Desulfoplanes sp.]